MCNLSQGIREEGRREGREEGRKEGREEGRREGRRQEQQLMFRQMYHNGITLEKIAVIADMDVEEVKAILEGKEVMYV